jgi:hypothetical protein
MPLLPFFLGNFKCIFSTKNVLIAFYAVNYPFSQKERWMPNLRRQKERKLSVFLRLRQQNSPISCSG